MLIGLGTDLVEVAALRRAGDLAAPDVFLTAREARSCAEARDPAARLAAAFAAKEAFFKAMPVQEGFCWTDIELLHDASGRPWLDLSGPVAARFAERGLRAAVSLSYAAGLITAVVAIEGP